MTIPTEQNTMKQDKVFTEEQADKLMRDYEREMHQAQLIPTIIGWIIFGVSGYLIGRLL
jgi:methyl coenzyme M reductase alpha subunit